VHLIESSLDEAALAAWYRAADAMVVTSLADGMNLVAKEFVAARSDLGGVVVLSEFAGAAHDLSGALIVNPYDVEAIKGAMLTAVQLSPSERASRMVAMRDEVSRNDVHAWAQQFLDRLGATQRDSLPGGLVRSTLRRARYKVAAWRT
jgi:trehalose 6-phosphate synthase